MNESFKAIIFDFDGTLYNFAYLPVRLILASPLDILTIKADRTARRRMQGADCLTRRQFTDEYNDQITSLTGLNGVEVGAWYKRYMESMVEVMRRHYRARDGLGTLVQKLHDAGIFMAVISDYPLVARRMEALGISQDTMNQFVGLYSELDFGCLKPAPRPLKEIAARMGVGADECLIVGDRDDTDGQGARNCGMRFIQIRTNKPRVLDRNHPVMEWEEFADWVDGALAAGARPGA